MTNTRNLTKADRIKIINETQPPLNKSVVLISKETGINETTLYAWKRRYINQENNSKIKERYTKEERFHFIVESSSMNEGEIGEYCRMKGIHPDELVKWKNEFIHGKTISVDSSKDELEKERKERKKLEKELRRKDKALAEAAALLVLEKKLQAIWDENEED